MHELALAVDVVAIASRRAAGARVHRVVLEVGKLAAVLPDAGVAETPNRAPSDGAEYTVPGSSSPLMIAARRAREMRSRMLIFSICAKPSGTETHLPPALFRPDDM